MMTDKPEVYKGNVSPLNMKPEDKRCTKMSNDSNKSADSKNGNVKSSSRNNQNTFVHKLGTLICDKAYSDVIFWNEDGRSFTVKNIEKFSKSVLPLHFKHNNFSSFIRQLNMYGFHKVNRSPRGHRGDPAYQTWEFSHKLFIRDRLELIKDIKRTVNEADSVPKNEGLPLDNYDQISFLVQQHEEMRRLMQNMQEEIRQLKRDLLEANRVQATQQQVIRKITNHLQSVISKNQNDIQRNTDSNQPSIFLFPPEENNPNNIYNSLSPMHPGVASPLHSNPGGNYMYDQPMFQEMEDIHKNQMNNQPNLLGINNIPMGAHLLSPNMVPSGSDVAFSDDISRLTPRSPITPYTVDNIRRNSQDPNIN